MTISPIGTGGEGFKIVGSANPDRVNRLVNLKQRYRNGEIDDRAFIKECLKILDDTKENPNDIVGLRLNENGSFNIVAIGRNEDGRMTSMSSGLFSLTEEIEKCFDNLYINASLFLESRPNEIILLRYGRQYDLIYVSTFDMEHTTLTAGYSAPILND
ncbi:hypothetical protein ACFL56_03550 [Candidatus Margulisiibacteriota bacterium]